MPLKLIGAGLGRTGTMSLKTAIEQLGIGRCYHMSEVMGQVDMADGWVKAADGKLDWEDVFKGYAATVDYPGCTFWRELAALYPKAKVLLSVRDPDKWFESTQETIFSDQMSGLIRSNPALVPFFEKTVWKDFGNRIHDRAFMVDYFKRHTAEVERSIPKEHLLVYEASQGWEPLCKFLGVPVPSTPFPRVNSRDELKAMMAEVTKDPSSATGPSREKLRDAIRARFNKS